MAFLLLTLLLESEDSLDALIGGLFFLLLVGALGLYIYRRLRLRLGTGSWNMAEARIVTCFATSPGHGSTAVGLHGGLIGALVAARNADSRAVLQYSYTVAGEYYSGSFMLGGSFSSPEDARAAANEWLGKTIFIRYNPDKPNLSVYLRADGAPKGSRSMGDQPPASDDVITLSLK
jgi:uncharacterized protein DUF3592